jgi:hypothetical protein
LAGKPLPAGVEVHECFCNVCGEDIDTRVKELSHVKIEKEMEEYRKKQEQLKKNALEAAQISQALNSSENPSAMTEVIQTLKDQHLQQTEDLQQ